MEEPKTCWKLRHHDGFSSGFPHLDTTFGDWITLYGRVSCALWGVEQHAWCPPTDARSIPSCAIQKLSLGIAPCPLEEGVTVTPIEDGFWKGRQDGIGEGVAEEETWVMSGLQNTWGHLEAICRIQEESPIRWVLRSLM